MTQSTSPIVPASEARPVLFWRPDSDETLVKPSLEAAAGFLGVAPDAVVAAIGSGDLLGEWFVDWEA